MGAKAGRYNRDAGLAGGGEARGGREAGRGAGDSRGRAVPAAI